MADAPRRPRFTDGQALGAADLDLLADSARNRAARHERVLHTFGVTTGLDLRTEDVTLAYHGDQVVTKRITVAAGLAIDGVGRQIVVPADTPLPPEQFLDDIGDSPEIDRDIPGAQTSYPYPVLLMADDRNGPPPAFTGGGCGTTTNPTTVVEDFQLHIGKRGEHLSLASQRLPGPGDAVADDAPPFRLLLGFVRFHAGLRRYVAVSTELDGVRPRRAGVRAGEVVTGGDRLLLRVGEPAASGQPALVLEAAGGGRLRFGPTSGDDVADVFSVSAHGDLTVHGAIDPGPVIGAVRVQSGVATNGMPLPLPPGVTAADLAAHKYAVHMRVTPRYQVHTTQGPPTPATVAGYAVVRCDVDDRRVGHCVLATLTPTASGVTLEPAPTATFEFLVLAAVLGEGERPGGSP